MKNDRQKNTNANVGLDNNNFFYHDIKDSITVDKLQQQVTCLANHLNQIDDKGHICITQFNKICNNPHIGLEAVNLAEFRKYVADNVAAINHLQTIFNHPELEFVLNAIQSDNNLNGIFLKILSSTENMRGMLFFKMLRTIEICNDFDELFKNLIFLKQKTQASERVIRKIQNNQLDLLPTHDKNGAVVEGKDDQPHLKSAKIK